MPGGGSQPQSQTTQVNLSPEQRQILELAMPGIRDFAATVPQRYSGSTIAPANPNQVAGQNMVLGAAGTQSNLARAGADASQFMLGDIWNPASNPNLRGAIDAATRPINEGLTESTLPAIRGEAVRTGNFGSSRQGIAEGIASREASRAVGDTAAKITQGQYETNINAQLKALGLLPSIQGAQATPGVTTSGVGDVQQGMNQARLSEQVQNFNYDQLAPFLQSRELVSLVSGIPGGSTTTTASGPQTNPMTSMLGGAATGASLGSAVMPGFGTAAGAGIGALLPFLFG